MANFTIAQGRGVRLVMRDDEIDVAPIRLLGDLGASPVTVDGRNIGTLGEPRDINDFRGSLIVIDTDGRATVAGIPLDRVRVTISDGLVETKGLDPSGRTIFMADNVPVARSVLDLFPSNQRSDVIRGAELADVVDGGLGNDRIFGNRGNDRLDGGAGADLLVGGAGADRLRGGAGDDRGKGGAGADVLIGGSGDDNLVGGGGGDRLLGDGGDDILKGSNGADHLAGGGGKDRLFGGTGDDRLSGGGGRDRLAAGAGDDELAGGRGADRFVFSPRQGDNIIEDFTSGVDKIHVNGVGGFGALGATEQDGGTIISFRGTTIVLDDAVNIGPSDFVF